MDQTILVPEPKTLRCWSRSWSKNFRCMELELELEPEI